MFTGVLLRLELTLPKICTRSFLWLFAILVLLLAACSNSSESELTLVAQNVAMSTSIADARITASVEADRMQITLEYAQTEVERAHDEGTALSSTLVARGTPAAAFSNLTPQPGALNAPSPAAAQAPSSDNPLATPDTSTGNTSEITATPDVPRLTNIVLSSGVGDNDCALDTQTQFSTSAEKIYVVATASNIPKTSTLTSHWLRGSDEVAKFDFQPKSDIGQACIWFYIDQTDVQFTAGEWSVSLDIAGTPVGSPVPFTIVEAASG